MPIRVLDATVAAQIAAGEVIERPASVVRELVENALDAGARRIVVEARGGGLREIRVQDDGCGIPADEVELAFARHATSKLSTADDLWSITTLGFRGEALPSIAAVAQVICITRVANADVGVELRIAGGEVQAIMPRGCSPGTTISVRNLFYNTPVRREFLRSDATESAAIAAVVTQYALAYPEVRFSLSIDGRTTLQTSGNGDLRAATIEIYGLDVARQLLAVDAAAGEGIDHVHVSGLVSPPGLTRSSRAAVHLFVNRRAIQPRGQIALVLEEAYHTLLMKGRHPMAILNISVHPAAVDVNVHPTKSEVKFRNTIQVMSVLGRAVRAALLESGVRPWEEPGIPASLDTAQRRFELRRLGTSHESAWDTPSWMTAGDERGSASFHVRNWRNEGQSGAWQREPAAASSLSPTVQTSKLPPLRIVGQIAQSYIVAESPDGMYLIDQHAAHERITYERLMAQRGAGMIESQELLIPQVVDLPPTAQDVLLAAADRLAEWGFVIEPFGRSLRVRAIPAVLYPGDLATALLEIADHLSERSGTTPRDWREAMLITLSCHTSVRAGQTLSFDEMRGLVRQLEQCASPRTCPHGRPTMILLTITQIERQFGRAK
ncbi:MAG: DNA mismatch repair endonuclease MutL [Roseiflexus sp.]|nr:DNA mismatch repair endonuclease MutL [Roseiflexus sp.]MCS7290926.1 DNA mismatch repair endonuclease MutL [Roseiflexus sp.]MDW8234331.1 DNA mismatch repair endonuclease MutL [Roseiflexaceae bacterium]